MATPLAAQLKTLSVPHTKSLLAQGEGESARIKVSLIFDPVEAKVLNKDTVLALGISGIEELSDLNPVFADYKESLFHESAANFERLMQTKAANTEIDATIHKFFTHLSPYFLLRPAHKAIEWLIFRYQIHFYNVDSMLLCALPYHESNIFVRLIQTLDLRSSKSLWHWIQPIQTHGSKLPGLTIATHAYKSSAFLNFVCNLPIEVIKVYDNDDKAVHTAVSFFTKIILAAIEHAPSVQQKFIGQLVPFLVKGLKSKNNEMKCSYYMILCLLCSKTPISEQLLLNLLPILTKNAVMSVGFEALACVAFMYKTQSIQSLPTKSFEHLCSLPGVVQHFIQLHKGGNLVNFWQFFLKQLIEAALKLIVETDSTNSDDMADETEDLISGTVEYWSLLQSIISDCDLPETLAAKVIRCLCTSFKRSRVQCDNEERLTQLLKNVHSLVRMLELKYKNVVDAEILKQMAEDDSTAQEFALMTLSSFKYRTIQLEDGDASLFLTVNHPSSHVRMEGVKALCEMLRKKDVDVDDDFVSSCIEARLQDDNPDIVTAILNLDRSVLEKYCSLNLLLNLVQTYMSLPAPWTRIADQCCNKLLEHTGLDSVTRELCCLALYANQVSRMEILDTLCILLRDKHPLFKGFLSNKKRRQSEAIKVIAANLITLPLSEAITMVDALMINQHPVVLEGLAAVLVKAANLSPGFNFHQMAIEKALDICNEILKGPATHDLTKLLHAIGDAFIAKRFIATPVEWTMLLTPSEHSIYSLSVALYTRFVSLLLSSGEANLLCQQMANWIKFDIFNHVLLGLFCSDDSFLVINLINLVTQFAQNEAVKSCLLSSNQVLLTLISLLMRNCKQTRQLSLKLLSLICDAMSQNATDSEHELMNLLVTIAEQSKAVTIDHEQIKEILARFLQANDDVVQLFITSISAVTTPSFVVGMYFDVSALFKDVKILEAASRQLETHINKSENRDIMLMFCCLDRFDDYTAQILCPGELPWNIFLQCLADSSVQSHALSKITKSFYSNLKNDVVRRKLLMMLLDEHVRHQDDSWEATLLHSSLTKVARQIHLPGAVVCEILAEPVRIKQRETENVSSVKKRKQAQKLTPASSDSISNLSSKVWRRTRCLLEWLHSKKKISNVHLIIPTGFELITLVLEMEAETDTEYMKHLIMGCLNHLLDKLYKDSSEPTEVLTYDQLNVESVVRCIRDTTNPQTHQQALLLLSTTARMYPDTVLHHIMAVFTFMGQNLIRQDDMYSFQIINKTLETIIPEIIKASKQGMEDTFPSILRVFADAFPHIPEHRRLLLFTKLISIVNQSKYLSVCVCLMLGQADRIKQAADDPSLEIQPEHGNVAEFLLSLCNEFDTDTQLEACTQMIDYLCGLSTLLTEAGQIKKQNFGARWQTVVTKLLLDSDLSTSNQVQHYMYDCADFIVSLLMSKTFVEKAVNCDKDLTEMFKNVLESGLLYVTQVAHQTEKHTSTTLSKFWRAILQKSYEILDKINALLPSHVFISVVTSLMQSELPLIRRKAMDLLNNRLPQAKLEPSQYSSLHGLMAQISKIGLEYGDGEEDTTNRQTALLSLKILTRSLAETNPDHFVLLLQKVFISFDKTQLAVVRANLLLLIAELAVQLRVKMLPHLADVMSRVIFTLKDQEAIKANELLWISGVTALHKVVQSTVSFISAQLPDVIEIVARLSNQVQHISTAGRGYKSQLPLRLHSLREIIAKKIEPRVLVPVLVKCYPIIKGEAGCVQSLMSITAEHLSAMDKTQVHNYQHNLLELFLLALDYRVENSDCDVEEIAEVEKSVINACLKMVVKLSEGSFRPMYFKLLAWGTRDSDSAERLITFYVLSDSMAHSLKSLFGLFAGHMVKNAAETLAAVVLSKQERKHLGGELFKVGSDSVKRKKTALLAVTIIDCLHTCFTYDTNGFVNKQTFNVLMGPLVDQLKYMVDDYDDYIMKHVVPCLSQLAVAVGDDTLWKPLIYQICLMMRHQEPQVRKGALFALRSLNSQLGEDFLPLLPETIPFLAELMEDEHEDIELLCQEVVADMEKVIGEPLQKYF